MFNSSYFPYENLMLHGEWCSCPLKGLKILLDLLIKSRAHEKLQSKRKSMGEGNEKHDDQKMLFKMWKTTGQLHVVLVLDQIFKVSKVTLN